VQPELPVRKEVLLERPAPRGRLDLWVPQVRQVLPAVLELQVRPGLAAISVLPGLKVFKALLVQRDRAVISDRQALKVTRGLPVRLDHLVILDQQGHRAMKVQLAPRDLQAKLGLRALKVLRV